MTLRSESLITPLERNTQIQMLTRWLWGLFACGTLFAALYAGVLTIGLHSLGFVFDFTTRTVLNVESSSANYERIFPGDQILTIEDIDLYFARPLYLDKEPGDLVNINIVREGVHLQIPVVVEVPSLYLLISRVAHLLTGIAFCLLGTLVFLRSPTQKSTTPFLVMCACVTIIMVALDLRAYRYPTPLLLLYYVGLAFFGATFIHVHTFFPVERRGYWQIVVRIAYLLATTVAIIWLSFGYNIIEPSAALLGSIFVVIAMIVGLGLLLTSWHKGDGATRRKFKLLVFATFIPVLVATIVIVFGEINQGDAPYDLAYFSLIAWPLAYAYSMHRDDIYTADRVLYRVILNILLIISLAVSFLTLTWIAGQLFPAVGTTPIAGSIISVFLAFIFTPVQRTIEGAVNRVYYGTSYNYLRVLNPSIQQLSTLKEESIIEVVIKNIPRVLGISLSDILPFDGGERPITGSFAEEQIKIILSSSRWEQHVAKRRETPLLVYPFDYVSQRDITPRWIVPLWVDTELVGIWFLGARKNDDLLSPVDERLIEVIASTTALVLRAQYLLRENTEYQETLSKAFQQLTQTRDDERLHLSRELHDSGLQLLVAATSKIKPLVKEHANLKDVNDLVLQSIQIIRGICHGLRPTALTHGLQAGLQALIREMKENFDLTVEITGEVPGKLPDAIETNVYRIVQESLVNVAKHALTQHANLYISTTPTRLQIQIVDNGAGFPSQQKPGFGLIGQRERTHALRGTISIDSEAGQGTKVSIDVPLEM